MGDITGKTGPAELMHATACTRINLLLATHCEGSSFSIHPSRLPSASQVPSPLHGGAVHEISCEQGIAILSAGAYVVLLPMQAAAGEWRLSDVQLVAEEVLQGDAPDLCLLKDRSLRRSIVQTTTCRTE